MNHKRKRAKKARAGCSICKPWKQNGMKKQKHSDRCRFRTSEDVWDKEWDYLLQDVTGD